ncbi:MAG: TonB-dependent receptor [Bacteroidales bacterium]|nr:TonB-dependent receptor [Bacteroidales bacterium]
MKINLNSIDSHPGGRLKILLLLRKLCFLLCMVTMVNHTMATGSPQQDRIKGKVIDADGQGLPGVNVVEKGTANGTVTDIEGAYSIALTTVDAVLVFSYVGYMTEEVTVGNQVIIDITLIESIEKLDEVVVVGYGTMKKSDVTGAIVSVNEKALREVPAANLQQALQGKAAGLEVQKIGTAPGSSARIRVRGDRSITGVNDPLIILDGIPYEGGSLNDIDQNAISSVEVLKDASATAIYGSRGANGVILITTKRGSTAGTTLSYNGYLGITQVARKYKMFDAEEYAAMRDAGTGSWGYMPLELESMEMGRSTNWQNLMYEDGYVTDNNLLITGGTENVQFSVGGGYYKETTILPGQDFARYALRANVETKLGKRVKIGLNTLNSVNVSNGTQFINQQPNTSGFSNSPFGGSIMFPILTLSPLMPPYDTLGNILIRPGGNSEDRENQYNPLMLKENNNDWVDRTRRLRTFNTLYAEVDIVKGLKYRLNLGLDYRQQEFDQFQGRDSYFRTRDQSARARVNNGDGWGYTFENILSYQNTFAEMHNLNMTGLFSMQEDHVHNTVVGKEGITADFIQFYDINQSDPEGTLTLSGNEASWSLLSFMLRINYSFKERYLLTLTGRADGSSRLAEKWHYYPAVSMGWNIHNEAFMKNQNILSTLKLRAGWGETSNQSVDPYSTLGGVTNYVYSGTSPIPIRYNYGVDQLVSGYYINKIPDKTLDWEYTRTINSGLDFGFLANRISGTFEVYYAKTYNILYNVTLPISSGITGAFLSNVGEMENKGFEFTVSAIPVQLSNFTWSLDLNIFLNRNKILKLYRDIERDVQGQLHVGHPFNAIYDYEKLGIWQTEEAEEAASFGQLPGQLKIKDQNNDGDITSDLDRKVIGSGEAKWQGGITNRFVYKGIDLSFVIYARFGGTLVSYLHQPTRGYYTIMDGRRNGLKVDYWTPENETDWFTLPQAANNYSINPPNASAAWQTLGYYDASFVKMRSISLGYSIPKKLLDFVKIDVLRFYFTTQNPFLIYAPYVTKWNGVDPEPTGTGTIGAVGQADNLRNSGNNPALVIGGSTPPTRSYMFGLNITF